MGGPENAVSILRKGPSDERPDGKPTSLGQEKRPKHSKDRDRRVEWQWVRAEELFRDEKKCQP